jgi:dihydrofolate synthase/folylpolyglutamate synthase
MTYRQALDYLYHFVNWEARRGKREFSLQPIRCLLDRLGAPHERLHSVHVAGTNGKGSTACMIAAIARRAGYRVGLYTSPHLHTVRERIQVDGSCIRPRELCSWLERRRQHLDSVPDLTTFDVLTALAIDHFADAQVDLAVIEVGLGGRLDSTNVITPRASVITRIDIDHVNTLGGDLASIAAEKAGIVKSGVPVISAPQAAEALDVLREICRTRSAPLQLVDEMWSWHQIASSPASQSLAVRPISPKEAAAFELRLGMLGRHQQANAMTALSVALALREAGLLITREAIAAGLRHAFWPARLEVLSTHPLLVVDGAHNPGAAGMLAGEVRRIFGPRRLRLVYGASQDKDIGGMLRELRCLGARLVVTSSAHPRAAPVFDVARTASALGLAWRSADTPAEALRAELTACSADEMVLVCGSLFVAAEARLAYFELAGQTPPESDPPRADAH